jgi:NAD(P)-dependent dehydrogenase (short-subunit alcohol dehydrogenase family)
MSLTGKRVMVVGGGSGIGLAAARRLAGAGARVVVVGRSTDKLARAKAEIAGDVETRAADLADEAAARRLFDGIGPLDHLVITAAGSPAWGPFHELEPACLRAAFEGKFWPYFHAARYGAPLLAKDGSILFMTGGASRSAIPGTAGLAAVNGAIAAMARTLARELAPIRVNVLSPGFVDTPAYDAMPADARANLYRRMAEAVPLGRIGAGDELAGAAVFLLANGFTTGALLDVDGGRRLV